MQVDVARSRRYTRRIRRAFVRGRLLEVQRLRRARRAVDQRFDPAKALQATARYLTLAQARFKREDLAFVSYHMGMGNLESVLRAYGTEPGDEDVSYTAGLLRLEPGPPRRRLREARRLRRRLLQLPVEARRGGADHGAEPRGRRRARAPAGRPDRQGLGGGGAAPARLDAALRDARGAAGGVGRRAARRVPRRPARDRPARATRGWASWRRDSGRRPRSTRACAPRRSRPRSTSAPRCARSPARRR